MIPFGALAPLIWIAVRATRRGKPGSAQSPFGLHRPVRLFALFWFSFAATAWVVPLFVGFTKGMNPFLCRLLLLAVVMTFPWTWVRHLVVPLGLPRVAYYLAKPPDPRFWRDGSGRPLLAAAWALLFQKAPPSAKQLGWFEEKAHAQLRPTALLAFAFVQAARGDAGRAREMIEALDAFAPRTLPAFVRRSAQTWLASEAAEAGDWRRVLALCERDPRISPALWLLAAVAKRALGTEDATSTAGLWARWALAPRRARTWRYVREAARWHGTQAAPALTGEGEAEVLALRAVVALKRAAIPLDAGGLALAARRCEAALSDPEARQRFHSRAATLGATRTEALLGTLREAIELELASLLDASGLPVGALEQAGSLLEQAGWAQRNRLFVDLQLALDSLRTRAAKDRPLLEPHEEWAEWARIRSLHRRICDLGADARRAAFHDVHDPVCSYGVRLFNVERQRPFGNAIFRFLLEEARFAGRERLIELHQRNIAAGL